MQILINEEGRANMHYDLPLEYFSKTALQGKYHHEELAQAIAENKYKTYSVITLADRLADEHWDDPLYMHKTNHICVCEAMDIVRRNRINKYYSREELSSLMEKYEFPAKEFNFKEDEGRAFKFRLEDELFHYQETCDLVEFMSSILEDTKYKLDEDGYAVEDDNEEYIVLTDEAEIKEQRKRLLERYLRPRVQTTHDRVYNLPDPLSFWDYRSRWHQCFCVEIPEEGITIARRGGSGSSGAREENGKWAHTFGYLANKYGIETPTFFMRYDSHNVWREEFRIDTFATLGYDLSGNYPSSRETMKPLFEGRVWCVTNPEDQGAAKYEKVEKDSWW